MERKENKRVTLVKKRFSVRGRKNSKKVNGSMRLYRHRANRLDNHNLLWMNKVIGNLNVTTSKNEKLFLKMTKGKRRKVYQSS